MSETETARESDELQQPADATDEDIWEHRCSDGVGGCTAISVSYLDRLTSRIAELTQALEEIRDAKVVRQEGAEVPGLTKDRVLVLAMRSIAAEALTPTTPKEEA